MISVVIPTFNGQEYIAEALDSVLKQSCRDFEIIVIDDGSMDRTKSVVEKFVDKFPREIRYFYQENKGIGAARNRGVSESRGEYIAFLDHDDVAHEDWLLKISEKFNMGRDICAFRAKIVASKSETLVQRISALKADSFDTNSEDSLYFFSTGTVFHKDRIDSLGKFDESFKIGGEDLDLALRMAKAGQKVIYVPQAVVYYRARPSLNALLKQRYQYGFGKVLVHNKHIFLSKSFFQDTMEFVARVLYLILRSFARIIKYCLVPKHRKIELILEHPQEIICSFYGYLGRCSCRKMSKGKEIVFLESGSGFGGSSKCLYLLLKYIDKENIKPVVLFYNFGPNLDLIRKLNVKTKKYSFFTASLGILCTDLVYINNEIYSHFINILLARIFNKKCICHVRGIRGLTRREKAVAGWIDKFIAVSSVCKRNLVSEGVPEDKIDVVYDGVAQDDAAPRCLHDGPVRAGVVGRISRQKGQGVFIEAARLLLSAGSPLEFYVIGDDVQADKPDLAALRQNVNQHHLEDKVHFTGWKKDPKDIYGGLDIVVCPSLLNEALGNVVIESMAFGLPVIASRIGAYSEMIQDGVNGLLFDPGDVSQLAQKIELLLSDKDLREKLAQNARQTAKEKFDIKTNVAKIEQLIHEQIA